MEAISKKQPNPALAALENYDSDSSSGKENESQMPSNGTKGDVKGKQREDLLDDDSATRRPPSSPSFSLFPVSPSFKPSAAIPASSFYSGSNGSHKKRKLGDNTQSSNRHQPLQSRTNGYMNPFNRPINKKRRIGL